MQTITLYKVQTDSDGYTSHTAATTTDKVLADRIAAILGDGYSQDCPAEVRIAEIKVAERIEDVKHPRMARHLHLLAADQREQSVAADPEGYARYQALKAQFEPNA